MLYRRHRCLLCGFLSTTSKLGTHRHVSRVTGEACNGAFVKVSVDTFELVSTLKTQKQFNAARAHARYLARKQQLAEKEGQ